MKGSSQDGSGIANAAATYFLAYLKERIQHEIDNFCGAVPFSALELNAGLVELLSGEGPRADHQMSVRFQTRNGRPRTPPLEGLEQSHGSGAQHSPHQRNGKAPANPVKRKRKWVSTPARRAALEKLNKDRWRGRKKKKTEAARRKLQSLYVARSKAKKSGQPLPPLPGTKK